MLDPLCHRRWSFDEGPIACEVNIRRSIRHAHLAWWTCYVSAGAPPPLWQAANEMIFINISHGPAVSRQEPDVGVAGGPCSPFLELM